MKYLIRLLSLCLFIVGGSVIVNGQVRTINIAEFVVNNSVLQDGKIKVTSSNTTFDLALSISRPGFFDRPVKLEAIIVFDGQFGEYNASDVIQFTNADFIGPAGISQNREGIQATILGNNNIGYLKVKYRYYKDGYPYPDEADGWTGWFYHTKTYQTIEDVNGTEFIGPSMICDEGTVQIINPGTITFQNTSGIATVTNLGNNQYKIARIGSAEGIITIKSVVGTHVYTKQITIGNSGLPTYPLLTSDCYVVHPSSNRPNWFEGDIQLREEPSGTVTWTNVGSVNATAVGSGRNYRISMRPGHATLQVTISNDCGSVTQTITFHSFGSSGIPANCVVLAQPE